MKKIMLISLIFLELISSVSFAQIIPVGSPQITNFSSDDYNAEDQNWQIFQDRRGLMYFANSSGVLEFDGVDWNLIPLPGRNIAWRIIEDDKGKIYIGGSGEIGYLYSSANGTTEFRSILDKIPVENRKFRDVWGLFYYDDAIVFISSNKLFIVKEDTTIVHQCRSGITELGQLNDTLYVELECDGIYYLKNDTLIKTTDNSKKIRFRRLIEWDKNTGLLSSRQNGLFKFKHGNITHWATDLDKRFNNLDIYHIIPIGSQYFAIATVREGIVIIDRNGKLIRHITQKSGLTSNTIYNLFLDNQNKLWAVHNNGISYIDLFSLFTHFTSQNNLTSEISSAVVFNNKLYLGGEPSLYSIDWPVNGSLNNPQFTNLNLNTGQIYNLFVYDGNLFCNHQRGITIIEKDNNQYTIKLPMICWGLVVYEKMAKHIFLCSNTEAYVLEKNGSKWQYKYKLKGHHVFEKGLGFDYNNYLWTYVPDRGLARLKLNRQLDSVTNVKIFAHINNEKLNNNADLYIVNQQVFVLLSGNIFAYNSFNNAFVKLDIQFHGEILHIIEWIEQETVWLNTSDGIIKFKKNQDAAYYPCNEEYYNFKHFSKTERIKSIGADDIIFMHPKGISHYHNSPVKEHPTKLNSRIRKVNLITNDSIIFGGTFPLNADVFLNQQQNKIIRIASPNNSLRFSYSTTIPQVNSETKYQYKLENFDEKWSKWTTELTKDYTNLKAGKYTFKVKAKSAVKSTGEIASYSFEILPPWYSTKKAYVAYFFGLILLVLFVYRLINIRVRRKVEKVEKDIKIDLFTDISHEIKTPITLILSPLEEIIAKGKDSEENNSLHMLMYRNAKKLKYLVNLLLDLRKVETGSMHLQVKKNDIVQFVEDIYIPFNYIAKQHKIDYQFNANYKTLEFWFDTQKLEIILTNLLSNAFKYTSKEGKISVGIGELNNKLKPALLSEFEHTEPHLKIGKLGGSQFIEIAIEDTGIGISKDAMSEIFKKYYHDNKKNHLNTKSTGIGLAFAEKLIQLHRGEICVWSKADYGSKFLIRLSTAENYYNKTEIAEDADVIQSVEHIVAENEEPEINETSEKNKNKPCMLAIDDEKDMRVYLRKLFENDYQVLEAENGVEALKIIHQELPDIIISDIKMPEMTGIELCNKIKNDAFTAHIPVILLTGTSNEEIQIKGFESGANQYIPKPFNPNLLKVRVQSLLENNIKIKQQINTNYFDDISKLVKDIPEEKNLLTKATEIINDNLSNPEFNINSLASELGLSRTILYRKLKEHTDITPNEYIQVIRLKKSKSLLCRQDLTISEVAYMVGYNDAKYFSTSFKKHFSVTPKEYRESISEK